MLEKDFFVEKNWFFEWTKLENATEKRRNQKGEEKLKGFHRKRWEKEMKEETETRRFCNIERERKFFFFLKNVFGNKKKKSNNEEGGQREREHQEGTYKGVKTWKESTDRKRHEDDQNGNLNREIVLLARNTKNEIKCLEKKEFVFENAENNENETQETKYCVVRDRKRRKMAKTKQAQTNIFLRKRWNGQKKGKTWRYTKKEK